ncbi:MAG: recombinase family protein [Alicyclobacillus sp.]|nr:recombinase family protein [Alicyclobacillus sp.]
MLICAVYARVSDASQVRGESIDHQIRFCREIARLRSAESGEAWHIPEDLVYVDAGVSGTSLVKRTEAQRLIQDAREGRFQVVLFKGISRFARDTVDALVMLRTLLACGVRVLSMEENYDSQRDGAEFLFTIHSALAQAESEKTAVRVRMGARQKARQGKWNGRPPDGYVLHPDTQHLQPDEAFAPVIQEIFDLYLRGLGARRIAEWLNSRGQYTASGSRWTQRTVLRVLGNPAYAGDVVYGRRVRVLAAPAKGDPLTRRRRTIPVADPQHLAICRDAHPALVDRATFERAAAIRASRRQQPGRSGALHLLSRGLLRCRCGSAMTVHANARGVRYYRCVAQADRGRSVCHQPFLPADGVEAAVLERVRADVLAAGDALGWAVRFDPLEPLQAARRRLGEQLTRVDQTYRTLVEQFAANRLSEASFRAAADGLHRRAGELQDRLAGLDAELARWPEADPPWLLRRVVADALAYPVTDVAVTRTLLVALTEGIQADGRALRVAYRFACPTA